MMGKIISLKSGEMTVVSQGEILTTTLGSCVAFCVYDLRRRIAGMAHYLLPDKSAASHNSSVAKNPLNFGPQAIVALLAEMKKLGCSPSDLSISILGGCLSTGEHFTSSAKIARQNIECADVFAKRFKLKVTSRKVESISNLVVRFDSTSGDVFVSSARALSAAISPTKMSGQKTEAKEKRPTSVLIVDDSPPIQKILKAILSKYPELSVVGVAANAAEAETLRLKTSPDVMTLDIHMPEKDGVTYLAELMQSAPMPVIMISDLSNKEAGPVMRALEVGAFDYVKKPSLSEIEEMGMKLRDLLVTAHHSFKRRGAKDKAKNRTSRAIMGNKRNKKSDLFCIGASTGGTEALREMFHSFPQQTPPIVVVQHMPAAFTGAFAASLNRISHVEVKEAQDGDILEPNQAYIAPGGLQIKIIEDQEGRLVIKLSDDAPVNRFKPSVDYLFHSVAKIGVCKRTSAALLTGMGDDGARGLLALRQGGAFTIAQSEESCVVFGMPKAAISRNAAIEIADLEDIVNLLFQKVQGHAA